MKNANIDELSVKQTDMISVRQETINVFKKTASDYEEGYNVLCIRNIVSSVSDRSLLIATNKDIEKGEDLNIKVYWVFKKDRDCYQVIEKTEEYVIVLDEIDNEIKMDVNLFKECFVVEENKI